MRLYHKLHKKRNGGRRATLIRNCGERISRIIKKNPATHREIFEEIFKSRRMAEDFHGLEVTVVGKTKLPSGRPGYKIEHPWFPPRGRKRLRQISVGVCSEKRAREIGSVPVKEMATIRRHKRPDGILIEEVEEFCCLGEEPKTPKPGQQYENGILLCAGRPYGGKVAIGIGERPEVGQTVQEMYQELEKLSDKELGLLDIELGGGRSRPGPVTKAREKYLASDPLSEESPKLKKRWEDLRSRLFEIQRQKKHLEDKIRRSQVRRPEPVKHGARGGGGYARGLSGRGPLYQEYALAGGGATTKGALSYRYGEEEAARLGAQEREFKEEYLLKTGGMLKRLGGGKRIPINERFIFEGSPLIGVIWDKNAIDPMTGMRVGDSKKFKWQLFDSTGELLDEGLGSRKTDAARVLKSAAETYRGGSPSQIEASTIQEALITKRPMPSLSLGEHLLAQFIPQEKIRITKADYSGANLRDIMRWGIPTPYGLVEFFRDRSGYHVVLKLPSGQKHAAKTRFDNMGTAVEYAMIMMQGLTDINKWKVEEGPTWSEPSERRARRRTRNPGKKLRATRNPGLYETMKDLLAPSIVMRPKRRREPATAAGVPKVGRHFREIAKRLYGKEAFDFGFTFGVLRGIDTCGIKDVAERRRIRRYIEQQVIDAVYSLSVEAPSRRSENPRRKPKWNPGWNPKKNPDPIEALKDIVAPPFITRPKRKRQSISVAELPDLKEHFVELAWSLSGQAAYDFGFVFGVLRGIDTCGLMRVGERRRIRRRIEQELMDAAYGLSVEVPGSVEE